MAESTLIQQRLGGWWRLWIALTVLCYAGAIGSLPIFWSDPISTSISAPTRKLTKEMVLANDGASDCAPATIRLRFQEWSADPLVDSGVPEYRWDLTCERSWLGMASDAADALWIAAVLPAIFLVVGLTSRWIYRGFRPVGASAVITPPSNERTRLP